MTPEMQAKINEWRHKALLNQLTPEEEIEAVLLIRGDRKSAAVASANVKSRAKAASAPLPSGDDLLSEMFD